MNNIRESNRRGGFTLLELLVVIGLIAVLISISAVMYANYVDSARETATATLIDKIHQQLSQRIEAFNRAMVKENLDRAISLKQQEVIGMSPKAAEILVKKDRFRMFFLQRFDESDDHDNNGTPDIIDRIIRHVDTLSAGAPVSHEGVAITLPSRTRKYSGRYRAARAARETGRLYFRLPGFNPNSFTVRIKITDKDVEKDRLAASFKNGFVAYDTIGERLGMLGSCRRRNGLQREEDVRIGIYGWYD